MVNDLPDLLLLLSLIALVEGLALQQKRLFVMASALDTLLSQRVLRQVLNGASILKQLVTLHQSNRAILTVFSIICVEIVLQHPVSSGLLLVLANNLDLALGVRMLHDVLLESFGELRYGNGLLVSNAGHCLNLIGVLEVLHPSVLVLLRFGAYLLPFGQVHGPLFARLAAHSSLQQVSSRGVVGPVRVLVSWHLHRLVVHNRSLNVVVAHLEWS